MWTWREHANSSQHRKAPDTTKYDPRIVLQRGWVTSDSSLEVDSLPFEWMLLASSLNHQITAYLLWGENETRLPWYFQISALHFRPSLQLNGPVLNGKVCVAFGSPVDADMAFWAATLANMVNRVGFLFEQLATTVTPMRQRKLFLFYNIVVVMHLLFSRWSQRVEGKQETPTHQTRHLLVTAKFISSSTEFYMFPKEGKREIPVECEREWGIHQRCCYLASLPWHKRKINLFIAWSWKACDSR